MSREDAYALMDETLEKLGEHFDAVQICATEHVGRDGTNVFFRGQGNFFARRAICETFSLRDKGSEQAQFIAQELNPPDSE